MKKLSRLKRIKYNRGFTLTECLVALAVFAVMLMILMQMMMFSVTRRGQNNRDVTDVNAQVETIAQGDLSGFNSVGSSPLIVDGADGTNGIIFYATNDEGKLITDANDKPKPETKVAEIEGDALGHFDNSSTLRITAPEFRTTTWNEFDEILKPAALGGVWAEEVEAIDPNRLYSSIEITKEYLSNYDDPSPWKLTLKDYTVPNSNYVIYLLLHQNVIPSSVTLTDLENCSGRVITSTGIGGRTAVRITDLVPGSTEAKMTINFKLNP